MAPGVQHPYPYPGARSYTTASLPPGQAHSGTQRPAEPRAARLRAGCAVARRGLATSRRPESQPEAERGGAQGRVSPNPSPTPRGRACRARQERQQLRGSQAQARRRARIDQRAQRIALQRARVRPQRRRQRAQRGAQRASHRHRRRCVVCCAMAYRCNLCARAPGEQRGARAAQAQATVLGQ